MIYKRAIGMSVLAYISSLIVGIIVAVVSGIDLETSQEISPIMWYAGAISSILFAIIFSVWYFKSPKIHSNMKAGLRFGGVMIITGFVLDFITIVPLYVKEKTLEPMFSYYQSPWFWITIILVVFTAGLTGKFLKKSSETNS
jgi:magnesium-transporting ATPase (P-type)